MSAPSIPRARRSRRLESRPIPPEGNLYSFPPCSACRQGFTDGSRTKCRSCDHWLHDACANTSVAPDDWHRWVYMLGDLRTIAKCPRCRQAPKRILFPAGAEADERPPFSFRPGRGRCHATYTDDARPC